MRRLLSLYPKGCPRVFGGGQGGVYHLGHLARHGTWDNSPKNGGTAPWHILDVTLFRWFLLTPNEFGPETSAIRSSLKLSFYPYKESLKRTLYPTWAYFWCGLLLDSEVDSNLSCFGPPPWGLELDKLWAFFSTWKTLLVSFIFTPFTMFGRIHTCHVLIIVDAH
jgi:hypothetical protein